MAAGQRRRARAYALQVLFAHDFGSDEESAEAIRGLSGRFDLEVDEGAKAFAAELVTRAGENGARLDELIASVSRNWRIDRMSRVDRNILRLGTCELMTAPEVPVKVVINEAVELAKQFGSAESPAFVNGVLDRIATTLGRTPES
jgi:N utilization substance protein B